MTIFLSWFRGELLPLRTEKNGKRSIRPKIPVWISEIFVWQIKRYFPPGRTDLVLFPLEHISRGITRQTAEGSWWSGCFKCRKLHSEYWLFLDIYPTDPDICDERNSRTFFAGEYACKPGELAHRKSSTASLQLSRKSDPNVCVENRRSRTSFMYGRLFCIQCSVDPKDSLPSCSFSRLKELGPIHNA